MDSKSDITDIEPVPLIPKITTSVCPDTSHIIREEFQNLLGLNAFPKPIVENIEEFNSELSELNACANETLASFKELQKNTYDLTKAEMAIMQCQATYLVENKEALKHMFYSILPNIDPEIVEKYHLIQIDDIFPHIALRILNNKMKPLDFIFKDPCRKYIRKLYRKETKGECSGFIPKLSHEIHSSINFNILRAEKTRNHELAKKPDYHNKQVFIVRPKQLVFRNFTPKIVYQKKVYLQNITGDSQRVIPSNLPRTSKFFIKDQKLVTKIAPGMTAIFTIGFLADKIQNYYEELVFNVLGSEPIYVELSSYREKPYLKGLIYYNEFFSEKVSIESIKNRVLNYTIDCGSVLLGLSTEINFILQNIGGDGRFFFVTENDWVNRELTCITDTNELITENFTIYPAYFHLLKNQICELRIVFCPTEEGLCTEKLFLLSDSNGTDEIDLLGDCALFEPGFFSFQTPDCPFTLFRGRNQPKNVLHLGAIYKNQAITGSFSVFNHSMLHIPFEWRIEEYENSLDYYSIDKNWVEIYPDRGYLNQLQKIHFNVRIQMNGNEYGLYKFGLKMYVIDIPEVSLTEETIFTYGEEYRSKDLLQKMLTILVGNIEVQIHHKKVDVQIYPEKLVFPHLIFNSLSAKTFVKVENNGFCCLSFKWIQEEKKNDQITIDIEPQCFDLDKNKSTFCSVTVNTTSYKDIDEIYTLIINEDYKKKLYIQGKVDKPRIKISKTFVDFGNVLRCQEITTNITIQNKSDDLIYWEALEYNYDFNESTFIEISNNLSSNCGELCHKQSFCEIQYKLDTSLEKKFFSVLIFYIIHNSERYEAGNIFLIGSIYKPNVSIVTEDGLDLCDIEEIHYVNETAIKTFKLYNNSIVKALYYWDIPNGMHIDYITYTFDKYDGIIEPLSSIDVELRITYTKPGVIYDYYIPCCIVTLFEPLILQILGVVKRKQVEFYLPIHDTIRMIIWPHGHDIVEFYGEDQEPKVELTSVVHDGDTTSVDSSSVASDVSIPPHFETVQDLFAYLNQIDLCGEDDYVEPILSTHTKLSIDSNSIFASETSICEYVIDCIDINCKEVFSKSFVIVNPMQNPIKYSISIKNFNKKEVARNRVENLYISLKWKNDNSYHLQLSAHGIVVFIDPCEGVIQGGSSNTINIKIYAETWGYYLEEVCIDFEEIPSFYMNIFMKVIGFPIEFPLMVNNERVLRFTSIQKCSAVQTRDVTLTNISNIPLLIIWHIYQKNVPDFCKGPINIIYDLFQFDCNNSEELQAKLKIIKYTGKEINCHSEIFKIRPKEMHIKPNETKKIYVSFDPDSFNYLQTNLNVEGALIGHIYLEDKYKKDSACTLRNPDKDLKHIKVDIQVNIVQGSLNLDCVRGQRNISINVNDILNGTKDMDIITLVFQNNSKTNLSVKMEIRKPFQIIKMRSLVSESKTAEYKKNEAVVFYNDCVEVTLSLKIRQVYLEDYSKILYNVEKKYLDGIDVLSDNQIKLSRELKIIQECNNDQKYTLSAILYFPKILIAPKELNFQNVCINSKKIMTFKLLNQTASKTWYNLTIDKYSDIFLILTPQSGYLRPSTIAPRYLYIDVEFLPKKCQIYKTVITVNTKLKHYQQTIKLEGIGVIDEKYFCENAITYKCIN